MGVAFPLTGIESAAGKAVYGAGACLNMQDEQREFESKAFG